MSEATSYRFEVNTENKSLQKALQRQQERIKNDELMAAREKTVKLESEVNQRADWDEGLEAASERKRIKHSIESMQGELLLAHKATISVRREALKQQLKKDYEQYQHELNMMGKTFYVQRI
ncbi:uncharacterized protein C1orf189 homolog [Lingula anatina]|uniref:Uncharacterized protein C1orf189 homolog n=1 Tax=Lingula anatina TaxID=7574 RepID=A0A1S3IPG9_LINAN|nr:uncharacterized protein C1orf189 homolog [Lingula anatina]|eukprot:XP_013411377.1 uncharacterized protein C1orf189 homolog [Lingula anatina]